MRTGTSLVAVACMVMVSHMAGCTTHWNLVISEVGKNQVELYLDEPASKQLDLHDIKLYVNTSTGQQHVLDLGALGHPMQGGSFMIVWEEGGYNGGPASAPFSGGQTGAVPGFKVHHDYFKDFDSAASEIRIEGTNTRYIFPFFFYYYEINGDAVRFGTPVAGRPNTGGTFNSDGTIGNPSGSATLQRKWTGAGPMDTNGESDWKKQFTSWGVSTP